MKVPAAISATNRLVIFHPLVAGAGALFFVNQVLEKVVKVHIPWVHAYLDDLICLPVLLGLAMQGIQWIHPMGRRYFLSKGHVLLGFLWVSLVFEGILPLSGGPYTRDYYDVICYAVGAGVFYGVILRPREKGVK